VRKRYLAAALLPATLVTLAATPAQAAATGVAAVVADFDGDGNMVQFKAAAGRANAIVITSGPAYYITIDDKHPIKAGKGCRAVAGDPTKVECGVGELTEKVRVWTHDRNDTIVNKTRLQLIARGGSGNDVIAGKSAGDLIYGESGADVLHGNGGADRIHGGPGNDTLFGGAGNDHLTGGKGRDKGYGGPGRDRVS
jgi:Ca2+-binding RTX toxin-like protein